MIIGDFNATGVICDSNGCIGSGAAAGANTTAEIITAANTTRFLINWSSALTDTDTWNTTAEMIIAANTTGFLINWSSAFSDTDTWNTTAEMQVAASNTSAEMITATASSYVDISGDKMTGNLNMTKHNISNIDYLRFDLGGWIRQVLSNLFQFSTSINVTGDINASGRICDSTGCINVGTGANTTAEIITAANTTRFLRNWSYIDTDTWNTTAEMQLAASNTTAEIITAANTTRLLRNWT